MKFSDLSTIKLPHQEDDEPKELKVRIPLEIIKPPKQEFMAAFNRTEPVSRDHTAIIAAKFCKRYYFYTIVLGFTSKLTPQFFKFGKAYHRFREVLEISKEETEQKRYEEAIMASIKTYGKHDPLAGAEFDFLTRERLLRSNKKAFEIVKKERANVKVLAVEQSFEVFLSDGKTRRGGKADQFISYGGRKAGRDFKTTSKDLSNPRTKAYYERGINPNDQFTGYMVGLTHLTGEFVGMLVVEVLFNSKKSGPGIIPFLSTLTPWLMAQWEKEQSVVEDMISIARDRDIWPMEEKNCAFCAFRSVCKSGTEQAQMDQLKKEFIQRPWDYKNLGEDND